MKYRVLCKVFTTFFIFNFAELCRSKVFLYKFLTVFKRLHDIAVETKVIS